MKNFIFIALLFCSSLSFGQSQFGQFWNTRTQKNPAFQAMKTKHYANIYHRSIWPALSGAANKNSISYNTYLDKLKGGVGIYFDNNNIGAGLRANSFKVAYNYQLGLGTDARLSFGTSIGIINSRVIEDWHNYEHELPSSGTTMGLDFGVAFNWKKLETGVGIRNILESNDVSGFLEGERRLNLIAQYTLGKKSVFQFFPQVMILSGINKNDSEFYLGNANYFVNGKLGFKNKYFLGAGASYSSLYFFSAEVLLWKKVRLAYQYQRTVSLLSSINAPSHEFGASFEIGK